MSQSASTQKTAVRRKSSRKGQQTLLVVDADRATKGLAAELSCEVISARTLSEAREILATKSIALLVTDLKLPDGEGLSLVTDLRKTSPGAGLVVTGKSAGLDDALEAFRSGATDFVPKPCTSAQLVERLRTALTHQDQLSANDRKIQRLRKTVRKLAAARKTVSQKVDLLCNDLVSAYGELSKQVDSVRTAEDFRQLCDKATDLEQLLCHAMDWLMRRCGYSNIAVFLATGESFQLGAYVKFTMASSPEMTEAMIAGLVAKTGQEGFIRMTANEAEHQVTAAELRHLRGQAIIGAHCTYLGDSLATIVLFRDGASPFTSDDAEMFRVIAPILAIALAGQVRPPAEEGVSEENYGEDPAPKKEERQDADWWKRGEAPPF